MIDVIAASVKDAITANCDADAGARLSKCVPMLTAAIEDWRNSSHPAPPGDVMLGAATPAGGILAHFANWPAVDEIAGRFEPPDIAAAVLEAIEGNACDVVIGGMAVLLGRAGIANHRSDALRIIRSGRRPLNVLLVEREGHILSWLATTVAIENERTVN